jgi:hypothetical protein
MEQKKEYKTIYIDNADDDAIDFRSVIEKYLYYWKWILAGIVLSGILGYLYLRYTTHIYEVKASILVDDKRRIFPFFIMQIHCRFLYKYNYILFLL